MTSLQSFQAKVCLTASGCLIHDGKVLLVKHKKLGMWLNPGGHLEDGEMPHQVAEREFWEETGLRVRTYDNNPMPDKHTEYLPNPILTNLHWISPENYNARTKGSGTSEKTKKDWGRGCEQHCNFMYLVKPVEGLDFKQNIEETDGIAWFSLEEVEALAKTDPAALKTNILIELRQAFAATS
jgi:8-oxo-dGTP pyrophosphatase MutT (NUDIX family)